MIAENHVLGQLQCVIKALAERENGSILKATLPSCCCSWLFSLKAPNNIFAYKYEREKQIYNWLLENFKWKGYPSD